MPYASLEDVQNRLTRPLTDAEEQVVQTRLLDAEARVRARIPDLDEKVASGEISEELLVQVLAGAVLRVILNAEGIAQETDGNYSYTFNQAVASGRMEILPEEWELLGVSDSVFLLAPRIHRGYGGRVPPLNWWELG